MRNIVVLDLRILLITVALFSGCISDKKLAEKCQSKFPCVEKSATVVLTVKHDTIYNYQPLPPLPLAGIKCFQFNGKETIEIFKIPCTCVNTTTVKEKTITVLDTAKVYFLSSEVSRLKKDSAELKQQLVKLQSTTDNKSYFYKTGFFVSLGLIILLAAFLIWRLTRK